MKEQIKEICEKHGVTPRELHDHVRRAERAYEEGMREDRRMASMAITIIRSMGDLIPGKDAFRGKVKEAEEAQRHIHPIISAIYEINTLTCGALNELIQEERKSE